MDGGPVIHLISDLGRFVGRRWSNLEASDPPTYLYIITHYEDSLGWGFCGMITPLQFKHSSPLEKRMGVFWRLLIFTNSPFFWGKVSVYTYFSEGGSLRSETSRLWNCCVSQGSPKGSVFFSIKRRAKGEGKPTKNSMGLARGKRTFLLLLFWGDEFGAYFRKWLLVSGRVEVNQ